MRPNRPAPSWKLSRRLLRLAFNVAEHIGPSLASMHWHIPREAYAPPAEPCDRCPSPFGPPPGHPERLIPEVGATRAERALWAQLDLGAIAKSKAWSQRRCPHT
ncbi:DUF6059 family protein [Streptosporangium jomthongense]|uniref:DUF6059 family protein n=1 Tax=Streptosporangium jomthongense TaxID=1193683 RepID=A0ABV8FA47_9ACTN